MKKAMIFAAGLGTRLRPLTNNTPKALIPVLDKTLLEYTILKLKAAGIEEIAINVHHHAGQIIDFLKERNSFDMPVVVSDESERLLDTGGGLKKLASFFSEDDFLVHNVDIFSNLDLRELIARHRASPGRLATLTVSARDTNRYLLFDNNQMLRGWVNHQSGETRPLENMDYKKYRQLAFAGIQVVSPRIFELMEAEDEKFPIIDFYLRHCNNHEIMGFVPDNFRMLDVGKLEAIAEAEEFVKNEI